MSGKLEGKVAIVTGSSAGIGKATAVLFAKWGACVTLCGRNKDRLDSALEECIHVSGGQSARFVSFVGDIVERDVRERIVDDTVAKFGHLDILVSNHGASPGHGSWDRVTEDYFDKVININLKSTFFIIQRALPHLIKSKGNVVTVSSIASVIPASSLYVYSMSKSGTDNLTRNLAKTMAPLGVRVNTVTPGPVKTMFFRDFDPSSGITQETMEAMVRQRVPLHKIAEPEEVAESIGFLVCDSTAGFMTGANMFIDGGSSITDPFSFVAQ